MTYDLNQEKFENAVLYILQHAPSAPGMTGLLKMLYFSDYAHYREHLSPITGARYVALPNGPVVDDYKRHFAALVDAGVLHPREVPTGGSQAKLEFRALREPDTSVFTPSELAVLDAVIEDCGSATGSMLSEKAHREGPWSLVWDPKDAGREIPYVLFRWLDNLPDEDDAEFVRSQLAQMDLETELANRRYG
jgi:uncharacterized phage-associated protein